MRTLKFVPNTLSLTAMGVWRYLRNYLAVRWVGILNKVSKKRFTRRKNIIVKSY